MNINVIDNGYSISYEIGHSDPILINGKPFKTVELDCRGEHGWVRTSQGKRDWDSITCWMNQSNGVAVHYGQMWYGSVLIGEELLQ